MNVIVDKYNILTSAADFCFLMREFIKLKIIVYKHNNKIALDILMHKSIIYSLHYAWGSLGQTEMEYVNTTIAMKVIKEHIW